MTLTPEEREAVEKMLFVYRAPWYSADPDGKMIWSKDGHHIASVDPGAAPGIIACVNAVARSLVK